MKRLQKKISRNRLARKLILISFVEGKISW